MALIVGNGYTSALVQSSQNRASRPRVIAKTSSADQVPDQLINMRRNYLRNVSIIECIRDNVDTSLLVKFGQNLPCRSRVIAKTSSTNQVVICAEFIVGKCRLANSSETMSIQVRWWSLIKICLVVFKLSRRQTKSVTDGRTDGRPDRRTDRRTDGRTDMQTDGQTYGRDGLQNHISPCSRELKTTGLYCFWYICVWLVLTSTKTLI
jgi:hypothetical protein